MPRPDASLKTLVGTKTYTVWMAMLETLVPEGRTHRLAPLVAGLLQYAATIALEKYGQDPPEGSVAHTLILAEGYDPQEAEELLDVVQGLFQDAGVGYDRRDHRGGGYSVAESVVYEFMHWYDMPWEA